MLRSCRYLNRTAWQCKGQGERCKDRERGARQECGLCTQPRPHHTEQDARGKCRNADGKVERTECGTTSACGRQQSNQRLFGAFRQPVEKAVKDEEHPYVP